MTLYTSLNKKHIGVILAKYSIGKLDTYQPLGGGSENTNYLITTSSGKFVLTICEQKSVQGTRALAQLLEYLAKNNFSSSKVIRSKENTLITFWDSKPLLLKKYISGKIVQNLSPKLLHLIGEQMGTLHTLAAPTYLPIKISFGKEQFTRLDARLVGGSFQDWLNKIKSYVENNISEKLKKTVIHSDIFYSNVIVNEDEQSITLMDFEEATYYYRIFDVGMSMVGLCNENSTLNLVKAKYLLTSYHQINKLNNEEVKALKAFAVYAAAATAYWRYKHFNIDKPELTMKNHYLEMKILADHIKSLPDNCFTKMVIS